MKLSSSLIYDAALDDELFEQLPIIMAEAVGARSCVLHWRDQRGAAEVFAHSGYFSDDNMADYAMNFVSHDLWTDAGMKQGFVNRAWRVSDLVSSDEYDRSIFFNEWIRAMGDDTYFCSGSVMRTKHGDGIIGLHRGRTQKDFSRASLDELNGHVEHLRRMFEIRARVTGLSERNRLLDAMIGSSGLESFVLGRDGKLLLSSAAGEKLLRDGGLLRVRGGQLQSATASDESALRQAVDLAARSASPTGSTIVIHDQHGRPTVASIVPVSAQLHPSGTALLTLQRPPEPLPGDTLRQELRTLFGLSGAESDIALRLAAGNSLSEISDLRHCSIATVRSQMKTILAKTDARKQSDIVRIIEQLRFGRANDPTAS